MALEWPPGRFVTIAIRTIGLRLLWAQDWQGLNTLLGTNMRVGFCVQMPSVRSTVDIIRQGRATLLSTLQVSQSLFGIFEDRDSFQTSLYNCSHSRPSFPLSFFICHCARNAQVIIRCKFYMFLSLLTIARVTSHMSLLGFATDHPTLPPPFLSRPRLQMYQILALNCLISSYSLSGDVFFRLVLFAVHPFSHIRW